MNNGRKTLSIYDFVCQRKPLCHVVFVVLSCTVWTFCRFCSMLENYSDNLTQIYRWRWLHGPERCTRSRSWLLWPVSHVLVQVKHVFFWCAGLSTGYFGMPTRYGISFVDKRPIRGVDATNLRLVRTYGKWLVSLTVNVSASVSCIAIYAW